MAERVGGSDDGATALYAMGSAPETPSAEGDGAEWGVSAPTAHGSALGAAPTALSALSSGADGALG